jgi:hypothetical protein
MKKEGMGEANEPPLEVSHEEINFHEVARERAALRRSLEDLGISSKSVLEDIREGVDPADHQPRSI